MKYEGIHWPGDARMTVMFTIHVDGQSLYNRPGTVYPRTISYGKYGPERAVDRLLELTQKMGIACTYFVPGQIAETYPDMVKKLMLVVMKSVSTDMIMKIACTQIAR